MLDSFSLDFSDIGYRFPMIFVEGTDAETFEFGSGSDVQQISIRNFFISQLPVTQTLWERVMGENPAHYKDSNRPVECVSYNCGTIGRKASTWKQCSGQVGSHKRT